ncbi:unnamed protein product [Gongylonema pulchrum]|uniref:Apple domain-containing protein n=1 Tax=Gongylonema pulchrum TaxID=637853 RepID=A0A183DHB9_9BILA|nr:unnamed protein product [Gongylonema pulchrum]
MSHRCFSQLLRAVGLYSCRMHSNGCSFCVHKSFGFRLFHPGLIGQNKIMRGSNRKTNKFTVTQCQKLCLQTVVGSSCSFVNTDFSFYCVRDPFGKVVSR